MWRYADEPWQYRVLDALPRGIDEAELEEARRMTPAERIDAVMAMMKAGEELQRAVAAAKKASR